MKKFTITLIGLSLFIGLSISAQNIPNGNFETWTTNSNGGITPEHWTAVHNTNEVQDVFKVEPGYDSEYAAELKVVSIEGAIEAALLNFDDIPVDKRYYYLALYYKGSPVENDSLYVSITMSKNGNDVGEGSVTLSEEQDSFTKLTIQINYSSGDIPDNANIIVASGNKFEYGAHEGTTYILDNFELTETSGIYDPVSSSFLGSAYPNPAIKQVNIPFILAQSQKLSLSVFDMQGHKAFNISDKLFMQGENEISIPISNFITGVYHYTINFSNGITAAGTFIVKQDE
jgi:hypothetical protein